uniref:Rhophilin-2 n=1 Tax=Cacopsylla melanoneura TaxID=428564 RepID=A0A8D8V8P2_9HEMI
MTTNNDVDYDDKSDADDGANHFSRERLTPKRFKRKSLVLKSKREEKNGQIKTDVQANGMKSYPSSSAVNHATANNTNNKSSVENLKSHYQNIIHQNSQQIEHISTQNVSNAMRNRTAEIQINSNKRVDNSEPKDKSHLENERNGISITNHTSNTSRDNQTKVREQNVQRTLTNKLSEMNMKNCDNFNDDADVGVRKNNFIFNRGSDPRVATCRGKLQNKRSKLNQEINKELRLRAGAENLFKATTNRKLKETVALELSFVNSNLQLLKEQLAELNSSVEVYQNDNKEPVMPMIPLGLKETKEIDVREPFKDFILEHYSEDGTSYEDAVSEFMDMRQAMRTPNRDNSGISLLFQYYNQLYFIERRFFPPDRSLGIYFEWYDSLTGVPSCQRTIAFEKACVLFNMAAIYTQMGAKEDRLTGSGLDQAVDNFLRAAGTFTYVQENFTNAPSMDLGPPMLDMLIQLMLAQARECLFQKVQLQTTEKCDFQHMLELAQEAAQVAEVYMSLLSLITVPEVKDYVPFSWISLIQVKKEHYLALSHYYCASGLLNKSLANISSNTQTVLSYLHIPQENKKNILIQFEPEDESQRKQLGVAHLRSALLFHEESQRIYRMCRELRTKQALFQVLVQTHTSTLEMYADVEEEDEFNTMYDAPNITPSTKFQLTLTPPDFAHLPVEDLFKQLGPVAIFSAKHHWTAPRSIQLQRANNSDTGFGFSVRGDAPVIVASVDSGSLAQFGGMKDGDFIVAIGDRDVKWSPHEEVVQLIKDAGKCLSLKLVTPMHKNNNNNHNNHHHSHNSRIKGTESIKESKTSEKNQSPSSSITPSRKQIWNPFKKHHRDHELCYNHMTAT